GCMDPLCKGTSLGKIRRIHFSRLLKGLDAKLIERPPIAHLGEELHGAQSELDIEVDVFQLLKVSLLVEPLGHDEVAERDRGSDPRLEELFDEIPVEGNGLGIELPLLRL